MCCREEIGWGRKSALDEVSEDMASGWFLIFSPALLLVLLPAAPPESRDFQDVVKFLSKLLLKTLVEKV